MSHEPNRGLLLAVIAGLIVCGVVLLTVLR